MADLWTPLQTAIHQMITSDPTFAALTDVNRKDGRGNTGPQFYISFIPDWATYPYATTPGDAVSSPWYEFSGRGGEEGVWPIHIWCDLDAGGPSMCRQVASAVDAVLNGANIEVVGWSPMKFSRVHSTQPMRQEGDPNLFHQVLRYHMMFYKV